jgi:hypothetical protein
MFQHTLDRATRLTPPDRMVTVVAHHRHKRWRNWRQGAARFSFSGQPRRRRCILSDYIAPGPAATVVLYPRIILSIQKTGSSKPSDVRSNRRVAPDRV